MMTEGDITNAFAELMIADHKAALLLAANIFMALLEDVVKENGGDPDGEIRLEVADRVVTLSPLEAKP